MSFDLDSFELVIPFGKHRGTFVSELARTAPDYLQWMLDKSEHGFVADNRQAILQAMLDASQAKAAEASASLTLTDHQSEAVDHLTSRLETGNVAALYGGAGYGKSFCTSGLVAQLIRDGYTVRGMAVSYVASQVLAAQLDPFGVETGTVARTLQLQKVWENDKEEYVFTDDSQDKLDTALNPRNALIVDEASMIDPEMSARLLETAEYRGGKLIVVGDDHQLPPVGYEETSPLCAVEDPFTLTVPMRYSTDSRLYKVEQFVRRDPHALLRTKMPPSSDEVGILPTIDALIDSYVSQYRADPAADHRLFLFTRKGVVEANRRIRNALYGADASREVAIEDERLMVLATTDYPSGLSRVMGGVRYYSGQSFRVLESEPKMFSITIGGETFDIPHIEARLDNGAMPVRLIFGQSEAALDEEKPGSLEFAAAMTAARRLGKGEINFKSDWSAYRRLQNEFVRVAYRYATTVHRAQGQTCDYAYTAPRDLLRIPGLMGKALAYVALTRAKRHLSMVL